jgi:hypothetical protein
MKNVQIMEGGGKSSAISLGTSYALNSGTRVAIVVDADTTDPERLDEQQLIFADLVRRSPGSGSCKLFLAVPTLEGALFPTAQAFASTFGLEFTPRQKERYRQNWNLAVRSFFTPPAAEKMTVSRTKNISAAALGDLFDKPLLRDLRQYLEQD